MPNVKVRYSLGLTTLKQQALKFRTGDKVRELLINAGKVISQQIIDVVTKISPQHEVVVAPVPGLDQIVENNRRRAGQAPRKRPCRSPMNRAWSSLSRATIRTMFSSLWTAAWKYW